MAEVAVMNALINKCSDRRVGGCLREGMKCGVKAGVGASVGFLLGGPIGCAIGGLLGSSWAASSAQGPSLVTVLRNLEPNERDEVVWELLEALKSAAVIAASTNLPGLANIISKGENVEQIYHVLMQVLNQTNMLKNK